MEAQTELKDQLKKSISSMPNIVVEVVKNPVGFFRGMSKTGGFFEPLLFMIVMGVAGGIIRAFLGLLGLGFIGSFFMVLASIIIVPVMIVIFGFVGAGIVFVIWKIMGSQQSFETAYRCIAYAGAITPITAVLNIIPYVGGVLGLVWMTYLIVTASVEVHSIKPKVAWAVFGAIGLIFAIFSISAQYSQRQYYSRMESFHKGMEKNIGNLEDMTPEEQGKALGEFLKGMQKATEEK